MYLIALHKFMLYDNDNGIAAADYIVMFILDTTETFDHVIIQESEHL